MGENTMAKGRKASSVTAEEIKKKFPEQWEKLQERAIDEDKLKVPKNILMELKKEVRILSEGKTIEFGPVASYPFIIRCALSWQEGDTPTFESIEGLFPRKGATQQEKTLIRLINRLMENGLDLQEIYDTVYERVCRSRAYKDFHRRITKLCNRGEELEKEYRFDFYEWLWQWM